MSIATHLPALQVVLPLLAAPLTVLLRRPGLAFLVAVAARKDTTADGAKV